MPIVSDATHTRCTDCGFVYEDVADPELLARLLALGPAFVELCGGLDPGSARQRPAPDVWSPVEYCCHVRDVLLGIRERVYLALVEPPPWSFLPIYRDVRMDQARYAAQDIGRVTEQIGFAAGLFAEAFAALDDDQLATPCLYNFPGPTERTVRWVGQHALHEAEHHLGDVRHLIET